MKLQLAESLVFFVELRSVYLRFGLYAICRIKISIAHLNLSVFLCSSIDLDFWFCFWLSSCFLLLSPLWLVAIVHFPSRDLILWLFFQFTSPVIHLNYLPSIHTYPWTGDSQMCTRISSTYSTNPNQTARLREL